MLLHHLFFIFTFFQSFRSVPFLTHLPSLLPHLHLVFYFSLRFSFALLLHALFLHHLSYLSTCPFYHLLSFFSSTSSLVFLFFRTLLLCSLLTHSLFLHLFSPIFTIFHTFQPVPLPLFCVLHPSFLLSLLYLLLVLLCFFVILLLHMLLLRLFSLRLFSFFFACPFCHFCLLCSLPLYSFASSSH